MTNTRPAGLIVPAQPATIPDPDRPSARRQEAAMLAARAAQALADGIDYVPAATPRELARIRQMIEFQREAANRRVTLRPLEARR